MTQYFQVVQFHQLSAVMFGKKDFLVNQSCQKFRHVWLQLAQCLLLLHLSGGVALIV